MSRRNEARPRLERLLARAVGHRIARPRRRLALVRSMVDADGGRVKIASEPGEGTHVTLTLPAAAHYNKATIESRVTAAAERLRPARAPAELTRPQSLCVPG